MGTGVEQKTVDAPEEVVDDCDVGCMQETFNTRNKSHSQFHNHRQNCCTSVWRKMCTQVVLQKDEMYKEVAEGIV